MDPSSAGEKNMSEVGMERGVHRKEREKEINYTTLLD